MDAAPPKAPAGFGKWLAKGPLNPASALFREDDYLLTGESTLTDRALYHSVLAAIAQGKTTQGAIASSLGREQRGVQYPLAALEETGFVYRDDDLLRQRRPTYRLADPILMFHHVVTRPDLARFEERRTDEAWADAQDRFNSQVLGPQFEQVARDFTATLSSPMLGGVASRVGRAVINDAAGKTAHELDVVVLNATARNRKPRVLLIGEAKFTHDAPSIAALERLERIRDLLAARDDVDSRDVRLALFSGFGFKEALTRVARDREDLLLFDLPDLFATVSRR
ncbi:MAG: hypothetical protein WD096_08180 [Actinomycetota bacterium]